MRPNQSQSYNHHPQLKSVEKLILVSLFGVCMSINSLCAQRIYHTIQLNGGAIVQDIADLYVGKLDYMPQYSINKGALRVSPQAGALYRAKSLDLSYGVNVGVRLYKVQALDDNLTLGALYLRPSFELTTASEQLFSTALAFELSQIAMNLTYTRNLHFDQNWWSYGFSIRFSKAVADDFE